MNKRIIFLISILILCSTICTAQGQNRYLSDFQVTIADNGFVIQWTTSKDFRCEDLRVEHKTSRSTDSFESIYEYPGICGLEGKEESYVYFFGNAVPNRTNQFRINLGIFGYSDTISIYYLDRTSPPVVSPNPAHSNSRILFANPNHEQVAVYIYDLKGQQIDSVVLTTSNSVRLSEFPSLHSGMYNFRLQRGQTLLFGRFFFM